MKQMGAIFEEIHSTELHYCAKDSRILLDYGSGHKESGHFALQRAYTDKQLNATINKRLREGGELL